MYISTVLLFYGDVYVPRVIALPWVLTIYTYMYILSVIICKLLFSYWSIATIVYMCAFYLSLWNGITSHVHVHVTSIHVHVYNYIHVHGVWLETLNGMGPASQN